MHIVSGKFKNRKLTTPKGLEVRPTAARLRESLFNICRTYIEDTNFLDLFAGSGAMGLEALSHGAKRVTFIDHYKESIRCIKENVSLLKVEEFTEILFGDAFALLRKLETRGKQFDIIYADPPYDRWISEENDHLTYSMKVLHMLDAANLLATHGTVFIEDAFNSDLEKLPLIRLKLVSVRRSGRSSLLQFQKFEN